MAIEANETEIILDHTTTANVCNGLPFVFVFGPLCGAWELFDNTI